MKMNPHIPVQAVCENTIAVEKGVSVVDTPALNSFTAVTTLRLLGDFQLILEDAPVKIIDVPRLQSLLAYLDRKSVV
jgi:hypothetical protein